MPKEKISCTVAILTHNSAGTVPRAFESVKNFAEIIVCDGNSADTTLEIAGRYGARVIKQSSEFLSTEGRITNYGGVRNQTLAGATYEWFFFLDSDEYISPALEEEIAKIVQTNKPAAYWVPRKYVLHGVVVEEASTYPNKQMRFFNRLSATKFIKEVHERIELKNDAVVSALRSPMFVPLPATAGELTTKWRGYLALEGFRKGSLTLRQALGSALHEFLVAGLYTLRTLRIALFSRGTKLPLAYEWARVRYQFSLIGVLLSRVRSW